jgi:hypothetical protein
MYDKIISIGDRCLAAHHIRRCGYRTEAYPFDWIYSDLNSISSIIENDFADFMDFNDPYYCEINNRMYFKHAKYAKIINHHHDLRNDAVKESFERRAKRFKNILNGIGWVIFLHISENIVNVDEIEIFKEKLENKHPELKYKIIVLESSEDKIENYRHIEGEKYEVYTVEIGTGDFWTSEKYNKMVDEILGKYMVNKDEIAHDVNDYQNHINQ